MAADYATENPGGGNFAPGLPVFLCYSANMKFMDWKAVMTNHATLAHPRTGRPLQDDLMVSR